MHDEWLAALPEPKLQAQSSHLSCQLARPAAAALGLLAATLLPSSAGIVPMPQLCRARDS